jgi:hypothetical protein
MLSAPAHGASVCDVSVSTNRGRHFGGSKPLLRQRSAIAVEVRAAGAPPLPPIPDQVA